MEQSASKVSQEKSKSMIDKRKIILPSDSYLPASKSIKLESQYDESDKMNLKDPTESLAFTQNIKIEKVNIKKTNSEEESKIDIKEEWKQSEEFEEIFGH